MRFRIVDILLVSTAYDTFILEEAGELSERMLGEFRTLDLQYTPGLTGVSSGYEAIELAKKQHTFNLIITTPHVRDMDATELARRVREAGIDVPVVLLAWDPRELADFAARKDTSAIERAFLWQGDARILIGIVKSVEDARNAEAAVEKVGVQVIILIEDSVRYYSSFLPVMYSELLHHSQRVISEGLNLSQKVLRMRARPKVLLCTTFEEAEEAFESYRDSVLGIISDVEFPRAGKPDKRAGHRFARHVRKSYPDIPIILHSSKPENRALTEDVQANFLLKGSHLLLQQLQQVMLEDFAFGDFVFRDAAGAEVARASDLKSLEATLPSVPDGSLLTHASRNHFSRWLKARTEFGLAEALRPRRLSEFPNVEALRTTLIESIADYRRRRGQYVVADFDSEHFDGSTDFYRIGDGSLGGKARGLAFVRRMLCDYDVRWGFSDVEIAVPPTAVIATDTFDRFLDENDLRAFAIECDSDEEIQRRFQEAKFPEDRAKDIATLLEVAKYPIAVRSSSLLEDSQQQPFTGVYETLMLPNNATSLASRVYDAIRAIKRVYASAFSQDAKAYVSATPYRLEEEKMAVMLQKMVGTTHDDLFYPDFSGVLRSHNFYPIPPMTAGDGLAAVALGFGRTVVDGEPCLRFCPRYPRHVLESASTKEMLKTTQRNFWAVSLEPSGATGLEEVRLGLDVAEKYGSLDLVGSTYSHENDRIYDGVGREGARVVSFAPVLKYQEFPLAGVLQLIMDVGTDAMGCPVEIEFAVNTKTPSGRAQFGFLQMRPLSVVHDLESFELGEAEKADALCWSEQVLGNGRYEGLVDLVVVDFQRFDRARSHEAAAEVARLNAVLLRAERPYVLIGVGRWGSRDPWLGIPVTWEQVSGARVIVESGLRDIAVEPSQGTHFFQNLSSFGVGYFTVNHETGEGFVDWDWLDEQEPRSSESFVRHVRLEEPMKIRVSGQTGSGFILKPDGKSL